MTKVRPLRYGALGSAITAPFEVRRFRRPRLAWTNERWLIEQGVALERPDVKARIDRWLLDSFAVGAVGRYSPEDLFSSDTATLGADRYGANTGCEHGGSGRTGSRGRFNIKGIGRSPLAAENVDWYHRHGCVWLEEAVREAITSEVARREFPHGAIPTVAVIDTGERIVWEDGVLGERRALVVRPNFVRLAHFQRSLFFGSAGFAGSDQVMDAQRTRDAITTIWASDAQDPLRDGLKDVGESLVRHARQIGAGRALRLWPGPFFSSNATLGGALVDFGSFRSLPNWERTHGAARDPAFGEEALAIQETSRSLARQFAKYGVNPGRPLSKDEAEGCMTTAFREAVLAAFGEDRGDSALEDVAEAVLDLFRFDQRRRNLNAAEALVRRVDDRLLSDPALATLRRFSTHPGTSTGHRSALTRLLARSRHLEREWLLRATQRVLGGALPVPDSEFRRVTEAFVSRAVGAGACSWPGASRHTTLMAQHCGPQGDYYWYADSRSGDAVLELVPVSSPDGGVLFGQRLANSASIVVTTAGTLPPQVSIGGSEVDLPRPHRVMLGHTPAAASGGIPRRHPKSEQGDREFG